MITAHLVYDHIGGFGIAFVGLLLIFWAERRARARHRSREPEDRA